MRQSRWKPLPTGRRVPKISNLFFVDDVMLFAEATVEQAKVIRQCLDKFCVASGQKVSYMKSSVYFSGNTSPAEAEEICRILEMPKTDDLGR